MVDVKGTLGYIGYTYLTFITEGNMEGKGRPKTGFALSDEQRQLSFLGVRCNSPEEKEELSRRLKILAAQRGKRISAVIAEALDTLEAR